MNYVVANRVFVKPEYSDQFEQRFKDRPGQIGEQPGFVRMEVLKPSSDNAPYVVLTHWQDETAFRNWIGSDDFKIAHQNPLPKDAYMEGNSMELHEVIISAESSL